MHRNSCPYCRHEFPALINPLELRARQRFGHWMEQWYMFRERLQGQGATPTRMRRWASFFAEWATAATNAHEEDMSLARTARINLFTRTGWSQMPADTDTVLWSDTDISTEVQPLASAILTRRFRECWLYLPRCAGHGLDPDSLRDPVFQLTVDQEASAFRYLCRVRAFRGVLEEVESDNEKWQILRSQGYTFDEDRSLWSAYPF